MVVVTDVVLAAAVAVAGGFFPVATPAMMNSARTPRTAVRILCRRNQLRFLGGPGGGPQCGPVGGSVGGW